MRFIPTLGRSAMLSTDAGKRGEAENANPGGSPSSAHESSTMSMPGFHGFAGGVVWYVAVLDGAGGAGGINGIGAIIVIPEEFVAGRPVKNFMNICGVRFSVS